MDSLNESFLVLMVLGIIVSIGAIIILLYQVWATEKDKADILSLYALLRMNKIK